MKRATATRWCAALVAAFMLGIGVSAIPAQTATAASASDWDPGYIIDDSVFYDSNAMNFTDIQAFLNSMEPRCSAGYVCLKDYGQPTPNIAADSYCNGYQAAGYQTAAEIIDLVSRSCGISQRVMLVLLEKEQGLVSSSAPSSSAYRAATGMACPDTAPCDPNYAGFFYQVYDGARIFQVYRANPTKFNYQAQRWNNIYYNPNSACGTASVFIYNQATAALYIYTPYTPNSAALANMYGTGDGCSSYGNRNFWRLFTDWFGNPRTYVVLDGFKDYWNAHGGAGGPIGPPISYGIYVDQNGQGWYQRFQGGTLYGSYWGGTAFVANNVILAEYNRQGGPYGAMGWPNGEQTCSTGVRCFQSFVNAGISTTPQFGAHALWGGLLAQWISSGGIDGSLGSALNDMVYRQTPAGVAWVQNFQSGVLVQSSSGMQLIPYSAVLNAWLQQGDGGGYVGWPTGSYACGPSGCAQAFSGATIGANSSFGGQVVSGGFVAEWASRGGVTGQLGVPLGPLRYSTTPTQGWAQNFAGGILVQSAAGFHLIPYGPGQALWSAGGEGKGYGWPTSERTCNPLGCEQQFSSGMISESSYGAYGVIGGLAAYWQANSGATTLGPAVNAMRYSTVNGGGYAQHFSTGVLTQATGSAPIASPYGPIVNAWYTYGAEYTWLGWPTSSQMCSAGACTQQFQHGVAASSASGAVSFVAR